MRGPPRLRHRRVLARRPPLTGRRLLVDGADAGAVEVAGSFGARLAGLLVGPPRAVWFPRTRSVHTLGMRWPIDVAFVGAGGVVVAVVAPMVPWRLGRTRRQAVAVLEAPTGSFAVWSLRAGSTITLHPIP